MAEQPQDSYWLTLRVPVRSKGETQYNSYFAGRALADAREQLLAILGQVGGLELTGVGATSDGFGRYEQVSFTFWYDDLVAAVNRFAEVWPELNFPDRTSLTHSGRFSDKPFYEPYVMIRWINGRMDPFSTTLSDSNLLTPQTA